jgi:hypothetical protein
MKIATLPLFGLLILLTSCNKHTESSDQQISAETDSLVVLRIKRSVIRWYQQEDQQIHTNTLYYHYDESGRMTYQGSEDSSGQFYAYNDGKLVGIKSGTWPDLTEVDFTSLRYSLNGDSILMGSEQIYPETPGLDTSLSIYIFKKGQVTELFQTNPERNIRWKYNYNADGNIVDRLIYFNGSDVPDQSITALAWDDKVNPRYVNSPTNQILLWTELPLESASRHNPTLITSASGTQKIEYTYNETGYPLTLKFEGEDFIRIELEYY